MCVIISQIYECKYITTISGDKKTLMISVELKHTSYAYYHGIGFFS